ncbi:MAG: hypothetical protein WBC44_06475 [Planctomycetaceae bacterium]
MRNFGFFAVALAGGVTMSCATVGLGAVCVKECGYVEAYRYGGTCFRYPDTFNCKDDIWLIGGQGPDTCENSSLEIQRDRCTFCAGRCDDPGPGQDYEVIADHDSCEPYAPEFEAYCHGDTS